MSGLFVNKVAGALLASALGIILINKFTGVVMHADVPEPEQFAYKLEAAAETGPVEHVVEAFPSAAWLGARDAAKGAKVFKKCKSCHTAESGGKNSTGPALWNVLGRAKGTADGFSYSAAMSSKGGVWGYEELNTFLTKPKDYVPKTKMAFNGLKKETDRAALIEFLRLAADAPMAQLVVETAPEQPAHEQPAPEQQAQDMVEEIVTSKPAPQDGGH